MSKCKVCGKSIPQERLEALPDTTTCVEHSNATARVGFMSFAHKTAPSLVMLDAEDTEAVRLARNAFLRKR